MRQLFTRLLSTTLVLGFGPVLAHAQAVISLGPRVGATLSGVSYHGSSDNVMGTFQSTYKFGAEAGIMASIRWEHVTIRPALLYMQNRYGLADDHTESHGLVLHYVSQSDYRFNYLSLPVNLAYSLRADGQGWQGFLGGYVSRLLGGHVTGSGYFDITNLVGLPRSAYPIDQDIKANKEFDRSTNTFYSKPYDAGLQAGIGYQHDRLLVQIAYSLGIINLGASYGSAESNPSYYNRAARASLVYSLFSK